MEIRFFRFELCIKELTIFLVAKQIVKFLFIVLIPGHDHIDKCNVMQLVLFVCGQYKFIQCFLLLEPVGLHLPHDFIQPECYFAVGASNHGLLQTVCGLCSSFIVFDNIFCNTMKDIFITDNHLHTRHGGFALGNILRRCPFVCT